MVKLPEWSRDLQQWDRYKAFYIGFNQRGPLSSHEYRVPPMVMFDTGEVIFTDIAPRPNNRGKYHPFDVEVVTSREYRGELYAPDGQKIALAWLYDNGQETLLVDGDTKRVVRVKDGYGDVPETLRDIPKRFQQPFVAAYMPGEGLPPVGGGKIVAWLPFNKAGLDPEQSAHVQMIVDTARAAMKLTDHPHTRSYATSSIMSGCPLSVILAAQTWQDVPECHLAELFRNGAQRKKVEYDYLLTEKP